MPTKKTTKNGENLLLATVAFQEPSILKVPITLTWLIREQRLHRLDEKEVEINTTLLDRPFWGKRVEFTFSTPLWRAIPDKILKYR